jgi:APA family basic amino acid/polyamine antiporter
VRAGRFASLAVVARIGAAIGSLGVLLSLIAGVSRTMFAMAATGDLPAGLAAVHPKHRVPHRAEVAVGIGVALLVAVLDVGAAIGFSSFTVLAYYAVANAAALTLSRDERRWPRPLAALGLAGCVAVAASLPTNTVLGGVAALLSGLVVFALGKVRTRAPRA